MKRKWTMRGVLLSAYCVPYVFLSVYGDAMLDTMLLCGVMIAGFVALGVCGLKTQNVPVIFIGNVLSFVSSCVAAKVAGLDAMAYYFKPFTARSLIAAISVVVLIVTAIIVLIYKKKAKLR